MKKIYNLCENLLRLVLAGDVAEADAGGRLDVDLRVALAEAEGHGVLAAGLLDPAQCRIVRGQRGATQGHGGLAHGHLVGRHAGSDQGVLEGHGAGLGGRQAQRELARQGWPKTPRRAG